MDGKWSSSSGRLSGRARSAGGWAEGAVLGKLTVGGRHGRLTGLWETAAGPGRRAGEVVVGREHRRW